MTVPDAENSASRRSAGSPTVDGAEADRGGGALGVSHLRGDRALPDELVEAEFVAGELLGHLGRGAEGVAGGTDGLVGFLRVRCLAAVDPRRLRHVLGAVQLGGLAPGGRDGLVAQRGRVRTHIGDVAVFVEPLGHLHRALRGEAQLAAGLLLQGGGGERRGRAAGVRLGVDGADAEFGVLQPRRERGGEFLVEVDGVAGGELAVVVEVPAAGDLGAVDGGEFGFEGAGTGAELAGEVPVGGGLEGHPLAFAVHHHAGDDGLHAAGGEAAGHLAPQHRGDLIAVEPVQDAPGLLGVHQVLVDIAQVVHGAVDGFLGDFTEGHPVDGNLGLEHFQQVPRDGLALAVPIGCEIESVGVFELGLELGDLLLLVRGHHVVRLEVVVDVDGELAQRGLLQFRGELRGLREVADVTNGGLHYEAFAEVLGDGLALGGRLHNHEFLAGFGLAWHGAPTEKGGSGRCAHTRLVHHILQNPAHPAGNDGPADAGFRPQ